MKIMKNCNYQVVSSEQKAEGKLKLSKKNDMLKVFRNVVKHRPPLLFCFTTHFLVKYQFIRSPVVHVP